MWVKIWCKKQKTDPRHTLYDLCRLLVVDSSENIIQSLLKQIFTTISWFCLACSLVEEGCM